MEKVEMGKITDFYVTGRELFYIRAQRVFRRPPNGQTMQIGIVGEEGRFRQFYIPASEASCSSAMSASLMPMLALSFQWMGAYRSFEEVCEQ